MNPRFRTIIDALQHHSQNKPNVIAFEFQGAGKTQTITWRQLQQRAETLAYRIAQEVNSGDRVLLIYETGLEFIAAFFGCLMAGAIAIPCFPPSNANLQSKLSAIVQNATPQLALHDEQSLSLQEIKIIDTTTIDTDINAHLQPLTQEKTIAFLQYSSGSTGDPKGVMVSHENIISNIQHIAKVCQTMPETRGLCWMPHTHDMGLVGHILTILYVGSYLYIIPPIQMIRHPLSLLKLISEKRIDSFGMPNFACELWVNRIKPEQLESLDMSHVKTVIVGAEPIDAIVLQTFTEKFSSIGFKAEMFLPAYGLAEATLMASSSRGIKINALHGEARVSCGQAVENLIIADPETFQVCADGEIGEVWLSGPSVTQGYWNQVELSQQIFQARTENDQNRYFRTGDLAYKHANDVYICGRIKEMIIIRGEKYFPQDIETTILAIQEQPQDVVVFSAGSKKEEELVCLVKIKNTDDAKKISNNIRKAVMQQHQLTIKQIIFVRSIMPRTTSGKKQRNLCKDMYLHDRLEEHFKLISAQEPLYATETH